MSCSCSCGPSVHHQSSQAASSYAAFCLGCEPTTGPEHSTSSRLGAGQNLNQTAEAAQQQQGLLRVLSEH